MSKACRVCGCRRIVGVCGYRKLVVCCVEGFCVCMLKVSKMSTGVKGL